MQGMLGMLSLPEVQGPRDDLEQKLAGSEGVEWLMAFKRFLRRENPWEVIKSTLLRHITTVKVPGTTLFTVSDHFAVGTQYGVKITHVSDNFKKVFGGKIEQDVVAVTLNSYELAKVTLDAPIIAELGDRAEMSLAHIWSLLTKQPNGEAGQLLTNGFANIFYVRDTSGTLWAVRACWHGGGWCVCAYSVEYPFRWRAGCRVFSR